MLEPLDYRNILDYLEYHRGTNQETVDEFYEFFMPYLDRLLSNGNYKNIWIQSVYCWIKYFMNMNGMG
ncbi:hypothetical protein SD457_20285 [Coprobacillaceae bacterium CR2/5/TPMF4]|nr:hypothetical protein SD457_20285 [Coprobacillaceae bacterium CR2/5/TPMF4]